MGRTRGQRGNDGPHTPILRVLLMVALFPGAASYASGDRDQPSVGQDVLVAVRQCMDRSPAPWPQAWREEYVGAIREAIQSHRDASQYTSRLQIISKGFPPYWEGLKKGSERSRFEVHRAEIRWYVESLMADELPSEAGKQKLRNQWRSLIEDAAAAMVAQFPFLDPNVVEKAKADYLMDCDRHIEAPLLPTLRRPFSEKQIGELKERWHALRYARVDLWRPLGGGPKEPTVKSNEPAGGIHPDYPLTKRSLDQLRGQIWPLIGAFPDYYQEAVAKERAARRQDLQSRAEARAQEVRLGAAVWQTEYLSFLLSALLETAETPEEATTGGGGRDER